MSRVGCTGRDARVVRREQQALPAPGRTGAGFQPMAAVRQLGLVSEPGMFVLGQPGCTAASRGREERSFLYLILILLAALWAHTALLIALQASGCF